MFTSLLTLNAISISTWRIPLFKGSCVIYDNPIELNNFTSNARILLANLLIASGFAPQSAIIVQ